MLIDFLSPGSDCWYPARTFSTGTLEDMGFDFGIMNAAVGAFGDGVREIAAG